MNIPFEKIEKCCASFGFVPDDVVKQRLNTYAELLVEWNEKMNLTAITEPEDIAEKHFLDCLLFLKYVDIPQNASVIDVGTGAGFPGIVLKIARPDIRVTLLDSLNKRLIFLNEVCEKLGIPCEIVHARAEEGGRGQLREKFDIATARAVAAMPVLCEYCLPYVKVGGKFVAMKGPNAPSEMQSSNAVRLLGAKLLSVDRVALPSGDERCFLQYEKCEPCADKYPRQSAKIKAKPL